MIHDILKKEETKLMRFLNFKNDNELIFCTFQHQNHLKPEIIWKITKKFTQNFSDIEDIDKIKKELFNLMNENGIIGDITKITCTDNQYTVEFSFYP